MAVSHQSNKKLSFSRKIALFPFLSSKKNSLKNNFYFHSVGAYYILQERCYFYLVQLLFYYFSAIYKVAFITYLPCPSSISLVRSAFLIIVFLSLETLKKCLIHRGSKNVGDSNVNQHHQ